MTSNNRPPAHRCFGRALAALSFFLLLILSSYGMQDKQPDELSSVLKQMGSVGKTFTSFAAKISLKKYTAVLKEFDTPDSGEFLYSRAKDGSALLRLEIANPGKRILTIKDGVATIYQPVIKQAQIANLGKNKDKAEYLALGIGQSPAKLQETFNISYQGTESVNGFPCSVLVFKPKDPKAAATYSEITAWIKKSTGVSTQLKLQEPSKDYLIVNFSNEKLNLKIPDSNFEQKLPSDVERQKIQ
jgi:outer membrane lipoprotein-sorting protein